MNSRHRITLGRLALFLPASVISLIVAEAIARHFVPPRAAIPWSDWIAGVRTAQPNRQGRLDVPHLFSISVSINSQRFRGRKVYKTEPDPDILRIAALGDSLTFGWGANDDETYPARMQQILNGEAGLRTTEVINAGVCATGTSEEALYYDGWVRNFHPQLVILNVFCNDVGDDNLGGLFQKDASGQIRPVSSNGGDRGFWLFPGYLLLSRNSRLFNLLQEAALELRSHWVENPSERFQREGLPMMAGEVSWLAGRVRMDGAQMVVVFLPSREAVYPSSSAWATKVKAESDAMVRVLTESCSKLGIPFLDVTAVMRRKAVGAPQPLYYPEQDGHPTPLGYDMIAGAIAQFLVQQGEIGHVLAASRPH